MKYIYLILCLLICSCSYNKKEDYNYLEDNSVRFIRKNNTTELLINKNNTFYLVVLDNYIEDIPHDYLIDINKSNYIDSNVVVETKDKIEITLDNKKICIYTPKYKNSNYQDCNFLYLYKISKDFYLELNDNITLLYNSYTKFNYKFMHALAVVWIDTYTVDENSYTTLTLNNNKYIVTSYKRRGKTIHKKINS